MLVAVPNLASFDAAYYGPYWAAYDVPRHLWHFTPQGLQERVETQGFRLLKTYPLWFDSFYISILSETYANNKFAFLRGLFVGLYSNIRAMVGARDTTRSPVSSGSITPRYSASISRISLSSDTFSDNVSRSACCVCRSAEQALARRPAHGLRSAPVEPTQGPPLPA